MTSLKTFQIRDFFCLISNNIILKIEAKSTLHTPKPI